MNKFSTHLFLTLVLLIGTCSQSYAQFREWHGGTMKTKLKRKKPPKVYMMGDAIHIEVRAVGIQDAPYERQLESMLESSLLGADPRLRTEARNPDTVVSCQITRADSKEGTETRTVKERKKVGQKWDAKKQAYVDDYAVVDVQKRFKIVDAAVYVSYQVKDTRQKATLDADNIFGSFKKEYEEGESSLSAKDLQQLMLRQIVEKITPRLVPTYEELEILLPVGDWKQASRLGQEGLWGRMRDAYEKTDPKNDSERDSYRYFGIGLAYEALAYQAESVQQTMKLLQDATINYSKAIEMNPKEKYFLSPQKRIDDAVAQYRKLTDQLGEYAKSKAIQVPAGHTSEAKAIEPSAPVSPAASIPAVSSSVAKPTASAQSAAMTNQDIIKFLQQGADEATILTVIKTATSVNFDFSSQGIGALIENKISGRVIEAMKERQSPEKKTPVAPRKKARS